MTHEEFLERTGFQAANWMATPMVFAGAIATWVRYSETVLILERLNPKTMLRPYGNDFAGLQARCELVARNVFVIAYGQEITQDGLAHEFFVNLELITDADLVQLEQQMIELALLREVAR